MKVFLNPLCFLLPILFIFTLEGCSEEDKINKPDEETVHQSPKITQFEQGDFICKNEGGVYTISFSTNSDWKSSINADWCNIEPSNGGAGKHNITLIVSENTNNEDREAVVRIECGTDFRTFKVSQKREQVIIASPESVTVGYSGGIVEINVQSNIDYTYTIQDDWISIAPETKSLPLNNTIWRFNIEENNTQDTRQSTITFVGNEKLSEVFIIQGCRKVPRDYDFEFNGLFYKIYSIQDLTVELVGGNGVYSGVISIPDEVEYNGKILKVIRVDEDAFYECLVSEVTIGKNVRYIGANAFRGSSIRDIVIPEQVVKIGEGAFQKCGKLDRVVVLDGDEKLKFNDRPFDGTSFTQLYVGRNLDYSFQSPFSDLSNTETITIGSRVTSIGEKLFVDASQVTELVIPASVTYIGEHAFAGWRSLKKVIFEDAQEELVFASGRGSTENTDGTVNYAPFSNSPLDYVYIGRNLKKSERYSFFGAFSYTPITKIDISSLVTSLTYLDNLLKLKEITIPGSVLEIGGFHGCSNLQSIKCESITPPLADDYTFDNSVYLHGVLSVPSESVATYQSADGWKNFFNIQPIANQ